MTKKHIMVILTYPFRLLFWAIASPTLTCHAKWCARPRQAGYAQCRKHVDEIMAEHIKEGLSRLPMKYWGWNGIEYPSEKKDEQQS